VPRRNRTGRVPARGQSLVEFTLILPIILILLLAVADFGRVYATGITMESSARAAAETAAIEYFREFMAVNPAPMDPAAYDRVHRAAWSSICDEAAAYPNATPGAGGNECDGLPTVVCVHDGLDPHCGDLYNSSTAPPGDCPALAAGNRPSNSQAAQAGLTETSKWVEVRVCYRFTTIMRLSVPFIGGSMTALGGEFALERTRTFTVADY
jgi:TadE-like protein